jgi:hypothetical protein
MDNWVSDLTRHEAFRLLRGEIVISRWGPYIAMREDYARSFAVHERRIRVPVLPVEIEFPAWDKKGNYVRCNGVSAVPHKPGDPVLDWLSG